MAHGSGTRVLTMGYGDKTLDECLTVLADHDVRLVVDVRAVAESSQEGFSADELAPALADAGLHYVHLGELGDFQPQPYPAYMETEPWQEAYRELEEHVGEGGALLLCQCPDVGSCHRRFLQHKLKEDGYHVVHLTPAGPREAVTLDGN